MINIKNKNKKKYEEPKIFPVPGIEPEPPG